MTTAVRTIWKKLAAAVFWLISGGLVVLIAATQYVTPRKRPASRHARPAEPKAKPRDEDARTIVWLARLHEVPARVMAAPFIIAGTWLAAFAAVMPRTATPVGATAPGSNDARTSVGVGNPVGNSVPWADVDQYLTDDAKRYPADFDQLHPVLAGELAPLPWLEPTLPPLPEPAADWKPHACGDVDQPTAILRAQADPHEITLAEHEAAVADLIERHGEVPPSLRRVIDRGGRIGIRTIPTQDVPGPAESASPTPPGGAEAATPPAVVAGPGTPDDTVTDDTAADRAFVADVAARPLDWAAWLHVCQHGDLDTVKAVSQ